MKLRDFTLEETLADIKSSPQYCTDENYLLWMAKTTPWRGRRVVQILKDHFKPEGKILDVGTSQSLTFSYLAQAFPRIVGIDTDPKAIKTAKLRLKRFNLSNRLFYYDGKKLPFPDGSFEGLVCTEVYEHVDNPQNLVKELFRVLKHKGKLIISAPNKLYPIECEFHLPFLSYLPKKIADIYVKVSGKGKSYDHVNHPTYKRFRTTVEKYFIVEDITFDIIKNYKKYYLSYERGGIIPFVAKILRLTKKNRVANALLTNFSAGWILSGSKL